MSLIIVVIAASLKTVLSLLKTEGLRSVVAEMVLLRSQMIILKRKNPKIPKLTPWQRLVLGSTANFIARKRLKKIAIAVSPATILRFHKLLVKKKYSKLYSNKSRSAGRPPKSKAMIDLVIKIKTNNPSFGCPRIAMIVQDRTGQDICEQTVRAIFLKYFHPTPGSGPSWLSFIGNQLDSLWSIDLFRVESILLQTHWVLVCMDQYSRRIVGFAVHKDAVTGVALCRMFNEIIKGLPLPKHLSRDCDPIFRSYQWQASLRILELDQLKGVAFVPQSRPFIERLIGTVRREFIDQILFWNQYDLKRKLGRFKSYYNEARVHYSLEGRIPNSLAGGKSNKCEINALTWRNYCSGLYCVPIAA